MNLKPPETGLYFVKINVSQTTGIKLLVALVWLTYILITYKGGVFHEGKKH